MFRTTINLDKKLDAIPVLSTISNIVDLFLKTIFIFTPNFIIKKSFYASHINSKSFVRCFILLIPILGNILVAYVPFFSGRNLGDAAFFSGRNLGNAAFELAFDWRKHPELFSQEEYVAPLNAHLNAHLNSDLINNPYIQPIDWTRVSDFLRDLYIDNKCISGIGTHLSDGNVQELQKAVAVLFNLINSQRQSPEFQQKYATLISRISEALTHCSNQINPAFDELIVNFACSEGALSQKIALYLQQKRLEIFRRVIVEAIREGGSYRIEGSWWREMMEPEYYLTHEAATVSHYLRLLGAELGIAASLSNVDAGYYEAFVRYDLEDLIRQKFLASYNGATITDLVRDAISDLYNLSIPTRLFTGWLTAKGLASEESLDPLTGHYKQELFAEMLREFRFIT